MTIPMDCLVGTKGDTWICQTWRPAVERASNSDGVQWFSRSLLHLQFAPCVLQVRRDQERQCPRMRATARICVSSLKICVHEHRLPKQELARGSTHKDLEMQAERLVQSYKVSAGRRVCQVGDKTLLKKFMLSDVALHYLAPHCHELHISFTPLWQEPEKTYANSQLLARRLNHMAITFPTLVQPMQDLLDPQPLRARIGTDEPGMGIGATTTCHFIGRGTRATKRQAIQIK